MTRSPILILLATLPMLSACGRRSEGPGGATLVTAPPSVAAPGPVTAPATDPPLAALLEEHCGGCHIGPALPDFAELDGDDDLDRRALTRIAAGTMPPPPTVLTAGVKEALERGLCARLTKDVRGCMASSPAVAATPHQLPTEARHRPSEEHAPEGLRTGERAPEGRPVAARAPAGAMPPEGSTGRHLLMAQFPVGDVSVRMDPTWGLIEIVLATEGCDDFAGKPDAERTRLLGECFARFLEKERTWLPIQ